MSITSRSLQKLLRENISGEKPLNVDPEQARELAEELLARVESLAGVKRNDNCHHYSRFQGGANGDKPPSNTLCCSILLEESSDRWYRDHTHLHLLRSPEQQLWVELGRERSPAPVSDIGEVVALVQAFLQRVDRQKAQAAKRQKQKDLKVQAILAQVRKIAKEDGFDFATEVDSIKLKLIIRLSDNDYFAILIPFNQFKEVLPKLRTAIQALRETYNSGVRFKTHLKRGYRRSDWVRHQDL
ncbi:hypothetical protein [Okeania sp. KiyG1]|uniref:hypothetical protein n=1 Tax=Okeania sp. KiyG1 TaxID=2720165 RepID=UPI001921CD40|nr:hypothetical protein [Okeania sp. KiyG1]GGA24074.1 hypothetical protein CYANOKiyG1_39560 [Okeania sp. KiyG1]